MNEKKKKIDFMSGKREQETNKKRNEQIMEKKGK